MVNLNAFAAYPSLKLSNYSLYLALCGLGKIPLMMLIKAQQRAAKVSCHNFSSKTTGILQ